MSKLYQIIFSPTGTSRMVSEWISEIFKKDRIYIDLCQELTANVIIEKDDLCIFSVPCYGGRIPGIYAERISMIHGHQTPAIICVTYGNRAYEDALLELADVVKEKGFCVISGCAVITEHNILPEFGKGRPELADKKEIQNFAISSLKKVLEGDLNQPFFPGNYPYKKWGGIRLNIQINEDTCINCGICFTGCPVNAVLKGSWQCDIKRCIVCMRCIKRCPTHSRSLEPNVVAVMTENMRKVCESRKENEFYL